jgi:hypothetical protein
MKRFFITSDAWWETKIDKVVEQINKSGLKKILESKNYGDDLNEVSIILMCRDPKLNFKQRIKFHKKEKDLSFDIMLDMDQMIKIDQDKRFEIVADKLVNEVPEIIDNYKFKNFDMKMFVNDLKKWRKQIVPLPR